jgi:hypothetical protein
LKNIRNYLVRGRDLKEEEEKREISEKKKFFLVLIYPIYCVLEVRNLDLS